VHKQELHRFIVDLTTDFFICTVSSSELLGGNPDPALKREVEERVTVKEKGREEGE
jgi:hypothetical protein